jgi:GH25 family lysozyme M1 (1,4-beta-N-acetylmuramidase)
MKTWERWVPRYPLPKAGKFADLRPGHVTPGVTFLFWQYTDSGQVDGIKVRVDRSVGQFDTAAQLSAWYTGAVPAVA